MKNGSFTNIWKICRNWFIHESQTLNSYSSMVVTLSLYDLKLRMITCSYVFMWDQYVCAQHSGFPTGVENIEGGGSSKICGAWVKI